MKPRVSSRLFLTSIAAVALSCWIGTASAQIPDKFTNLKVLPKTIKKDELVGTMRQFSLALGVRCNHCHVPVDSTKGRGLNFASDDKNEKVIARSMMNMVTTINTTLIPKAGIKSPAAVRCVTCHHGIQHPETLTDALKKTVEKDGVAAAQQQYRDLRAKYYGTGAYDFSPMSLHDLAEWVAHDKGDVDGAIAIANMSIEQDPKESESFALLGMLQAVKGDKTAAMESYKHALELDPENHRAQELLKAMQAGE